MSKYIILLVLAVVVSSVSQIILKKSASKTYNSIIKEYLNPYVIIGYGLMVLSTVLVVLGLKGVPYKNEPIIESLGYIFVMILSNRILKEKITKNLSYINPVSRKQINRKSINFDRNNYLLYIKLQIEKFAIFSCCIKEI